MLFHFFSLIFGTVITLVMGMPFGFLVMYAVLALRQLGIANKEGNDFKKRGAQKAFLLSISGMLLLFFIWVLIMSKM
jgi:hypothetical protein